MRVGTATITLRYSCPDCGETSTQSLKGIVENGTHTCDCGADMSLDDEVEISIKDTTYQTARIMAMARQASLTTRRSTVKVKVFQETETPEKTINLKLIQEDGGVVLHVVDDRGRHKLNGRVVKITHDGKLQIIRGLNKEVGLKIGTSHNGIFTNFQ